MCHQFEGQKSDSVLIHYLKKDMKKNSHICLEKNFEREWFSGHLDLERKKDSIRLISNFSINSCEV